MSINRDLAANAMHKAMEESYEETKDYSRDWGRIYDNRQRVVENAKLIFSGFSTPTLKYN